MRVQPEGVARSTKNRETRGQTYPRSCAFTATTAAYRGATTNDARPAAAAAASRWPTFDFSDAHCTACLASPDSKQRARTAAPTYGSLEINRQGQCRPLYTRYNTSIGSPSAVPVPCASRLVAPALVSTPRHTASISRLCDEPFGAVKLALGPSCYTADLRIATPLEHRYLTKNAPHPSPRQ